MHYLTRVGVWRTSLRAIPTASGAAIGRCWTIFTAARSCSSRWCSGCWPSNNGVLQTLGQRRPSVEVMDTFWCRVAENARDYGPLCFELSSVAMHAARTPTRTRRR